MSKLSNDFLSEYRASLENDYPELVPIFSTNTPLFGWKLSECLKDSSEKKTFIIESNQEKRLLKICRTSNFENTKREYDLLKKLSSQSDRYTKAYDYFEYKDYCYLVEEYIEGHDLEFLKESGRAFSTATLIDIGIQLCEILAPLHNENPPIIHKDIAPSNIIMRADGKIYLIDFGTVRSFSNEKDIDTVCVVTRATAAPEQYGFSQTDVRSDIFSIGKTLLYLAESEQPLPQSLMRILEKCTAFSPDSRYANIEQLKRALLKSKQHPAIQEGKHTFIYFVKKQNRFVLAFSIVILLGFLGSILGYQKYLSSPYAFQNFQVEAAVRKSLNLSNDVPISNKDLRRVTHLYIHGSEILDYAYDYKYYDCFAMNDGQDLPYEFGTITDLADIAHMRNLRELMLANQHITNIDGIKRLSKHLTKLYLPGNEIVDLSPIANCKKLETLCLSCNPTTDYSVLSTLTNLKEIQLGGNSVDSLSFLAGKDLQVFIQCTGEILDHNVTPFLEMNNLHTLQIETDSMDILSVIAQNPELNELTVYGYPGEDLMSLSNCSQLRYIHLGAPNLTSIAGIENLINLEDCGFSNCPEGIDFSPLAECKNLYSLYVQGADVSQEAREKLKSVDIIVE